MKTFLLPSGLIIVLACIVLAAGCTTQPVSDNQTGTEVLSPVSLTTQKSVAPYKVTIAQQNNTLADFIKMDSDVYNPGEIIEYYVKNEGSDTLTCGYDPPSSQILHQTENKSWVNQPGTGEVMSPFISYLKPGETTRVRRLITTGWAPGLYKIAFDCGISREFVLRTVPAK